MRSLGGVFLGLVALAATACAEEPELAPEKPVPDPTHYFVLGADLQEVQDGCVQECDPDEVVRSSAKVLKKRLEAMGLHVNQVSYEGEGKIAVLTSGEESKEIVLAVSSVAGKIDFRLVNDLADPRLVAQGIVPSGSEVVPMRDGLAPIAVKSDGGVSGRYLIDAKPGLNPMDNRPVVNIAFDDQGSKQFAILTADNVGKRIAIVLDGKVISTPIVQEPVLGGRMQISGSFTEREARALAVALQAEGALPAPFALLVEGSPDQAKPVSE